MKSVVSKTARTAVLTAVILGSGMPSLRADSDNSKVAINQQTTENVISELAILQREKAIKEELAILQREKAIGKVNKELERKISKASVPALETFASRLESNTIEELNKKISDGENVKGKILKVVGNGLQAIFSLYLALTMGLTIIVDIFYGKKQR